MKGFRKLRIAAALFIGVIGAATQSQAAVLTFDYTLRYGDVVSDGASPWLRAVFEDVGTDTVRLTMSAPGLSDDTDGGNAPEYADDWWFNLDPSLTASNLVFTHIAGEVADAPVVDQDNLTAGSGGHFDVYFHFTRTGGHGAPILQHLSKGESSVYELTGIAGLNAQSFNFSSVLPGGSCCFLAAAHIQSTGPSNADSDFVAPTVPEPSTLALMIASMLFLLRWRRRQR